MPRPLLNTAIRRSMTHDVKQPWISTIDADILTAPHGSVNALV